MVKWSLPNESSPNGVCQMKFRQIKNLVKWISPSYHCHFSKKECKNCNDNVEMVGEIELKVWLRSDLCRKGYENFIAKNRQNKGVNVWNLRCTPIWLPYVPCSSGSIHYTCSSCVKKTTSKQYFFQKLLLYFYSCFHFDVVVFIQFRQYITHFQLKLEIY